jgi:predicted RNase H-like HicB family nuclease
MKEIIKRPEDYLKEPYSRVLIPDDESGTYTALILEFPGCIAQGDSPQEAYEHLEEATKEWIKAAIDLKQDIPNPSQSLSFGGKILLRLPKSLHRQSALIADREGVSLNQFILYALAERVGFFSLYDKISQKLDQRINQVVEAAPVKTFVNYYNINASEISWKEEVESNARDKNYRFLPSGGGRSINTVQ